MDRYLINLLSHRLDRFRWDSSTVARCRCPICGDSHKHQSKTRFYFYFRGDRFRVYCHNCGYSASLYTFLKQRYPDILQEHSLSFLHQIRQEPDKEPNKTGEAGDASVFDFSPCIPIDSLPVKHPARVYVTNRKIPFDRVRYCSDVNDVLPLPMHIKNPAPSLVIPFRRKSGPVDVFQIRFFDPKRRPKYLTFKSHPNAAKVYNLDFVDTSRDVYVVEGPIDSMMVDNTIAVASSNLASASDWIEDPVLVFDNEPRSVIIARKLKSAIHLGFRVVIFPPSVRCKDLNDMTRRGLDVTSILQENITSGLDARLRFDKWCRCQV